MEVAQVLPEFADAFPFEEFNRMQRESLPAILEREENVVASAPTGSGKTALAELAICKTLTAGGTALFIAPLRALTNEKEAEWERFEDLGYQVYVVTGERDLNPRRAERADVLVMTPEKVDSATRKHDSPRYSFVTDVDLVVIDEVHLLDSEKRGSVLEVVVSRLRRLCDPRIVALSATMPNIEEVSDWLDAEALPYGDEYRPVDLHTDVRTYTHGENAWADKYRRLFTALDLAEPHIREDGQALVFVSSRQDTVQAAKKTRDELNERDIPVGARGDYDFHTEAQELENKTLQKSVIDGVAFHHAGLAKGDKDRVEKWFREGKISILFSTSTLAWGVNLPARCVVIRDTKIHDPLEGEVDMSPIDILQMIGRAGRPGYDDVGYGWVVCDSEDAKRYRDLLRTGKEIDSRLAENLSEHLNAEIAMGYITDLEKLLEWLRSTFYYRRSQSHPEAYGSPTEGVRDALVELLTDGFVELDVTLTDLVAANCIDVDLSTDLSSLLEAGRIDGDVSLHTLLEQQAIECIESFDEVTEGDQIEIEDIDLTGFVGHSMMASDSATLRATSLGLLASTYYIQLETAKGFHDLATADEVPDQDAMLRAIARAGEFDSVSARQSERDAMESVLGDDETNLEPGGEKVLAILTSDMHGTIPPKLRSDAWVIRQNALRLLAALGAFFDRHSRPLGSNRVTRLQARIETGVPRDAISLTAIDGIASGRGHRLADEGIRTPADIKTADVSGLVDAGLNEGVARNVLKQAKEIPDVSLDWGDFPERIATNESEMVNVAVKNAGGRGNVNVRVTVNDIEMSEKTAYLDTELEVPVGVFGANADELEFEIQVVFPDYPLYPLRESRTVIVD